MVRTVDVCVYGGTGAGCVAAVSARQEGASVLLIEPSRWLGGMLGAGIKPSQDCSMPDAVGGLTRDCVFRLGEAPTETRASLADWIAEAGIEVIYEHRLRSVEISAGRIKAIHLEVAPPDAWGVPPADPSGPGGAVEAGTFVDASYEGDVMALAGLSYRTGRESTDEFGEELAGVRTPTNYTPIDPYVVPGSPESGLVALLDHDHALPLGSADHYTQAYGFRFYTSEDPQHRAELDPPDDYEPADYELVGRYIEHILHDTDSDLNADERLSQIFPGWHNNGDYNYQRESLITNAPLGVSSVYQDAGWQERSRIWRQHVDYLRGLHHFMSTDSRVPPAFRNRTAQIGLDKTAFPETNGWPHQLYVRTARRLVGRYTLTYADVTNQTTVDDSVGLAMYGIDMYPVRRIPYVPESGHAAISTVGVATEGNMFVGGSQGTGTPYPVPYRAITPKADECTNLLVPVCLSATHIAYAATRTEPVFCVLGESAGIAAAMATVTGRPVQEIDLAQLRTRLLTRGQVLTWPTNLRSRPSPKPLVEHTESIKEDIAH